MLQTFGYTADDPHKDSFSMILEILNTLNIIEKTSRFIDWLRKIRKSPTDSVGSRFIQLFEKHDVHRNQIPRFFGHGLTLQDVQDEATLLGKLDESMLDDVCHLFGVRREWLEGAEPEVYPRHDFYKHPENVAPFLEELIGKNPEGELGGILVASVEKRDDALIVLNEVIGWVGQKPIYRYHLCNNWIFDYWKSRAYLTAFVAIAWKHGVHIRGSTLPSKEIKRISAGETLLGSKDGCGGGYGEIWYPEDMAIKPDNYLAGIDPEFKGFGLKAALSHWLELDDSGYMNTGLSTHSRERIRASFEQELRELGS